MQKLYLILVFFLCLTCLTACAGTLDTPQSSQDTVNTTTLPTDPTESGTQPIPELDYEDPTWFADGIIMIDCDCDFPMVNMKTDLESREGILSSAENYFSQLFTDSSVTDVSFCIYEQTSYVDSETMDWLYQTASEGLAEHGIQHYSGVSMSKYMWTFDAMYKAYTKYDIDWAQVCIDSCKAAGVRPWIYFRMNDMHYINDPQSPTHDSFWYEAKENGWLIGTTEYGNPIGTSGSINNAYDFSHEEVRNWLLNYIEEMVLRYDAFGFELDFIRNIYCFDYLNDTGYQEYMNDFIRKVNAIVEKGEKKHGHDIKLMVRLAHTVEDNYIYGFDVATWIQEGLVDAIVPSCEEVINSGIDVAEWRETVGDDVALLIGLDDHIIRAVNDGAINRYNTTEKHLKGFYASYMSRGADGCYLNNYYRDAGALAKGINKESASEGLRTFMVTHQDIAPFGQEAYHPLPLAIDGKGDAGTDFGVDIGLIRTEEYVYLTVGYSASTALFADTISLAQINTEVTLNGQKPVVVEQLEIRDGDVAGCYYEFNGTPQLKDVSVPGFRTANVLLRYKFENFSADEEITIHFTNNNQTCLVVYLDLTVTPEELD